MYGAELQRNPAEMTAGEYIDNRLIERILSETEDAEPEKVRRILERALELEGLRPDEAAVLLQVENEELLEELLEAARKVKEEIYGKRLVLFAPLYLANICENNCLYCGFRRENDQVHRKVLSFEEIRKEVKALEREGHKRLLLLTGESPDTGLDYLLEALDVVYGTATDGGGEIRRINVEVAPLDEEGFHALREAGIGTYTLFQETYHRQTYSRVHPEGPKSDYDWRLSAPDRAQRAGVDDIGIGVLFGLHNYRFEVLALLLHAEYLDRKYGVGPHTISVPRLTPALGAPLDQAPVPVSDRDFKKLVAVLRLSVPYTGMILSTRESVAIRDQLFRHGISQISAGSRTTPGGYREGEQRREELSQFALHDLRPMDVIIGELAEAGYLPSFCTACYRLGRTGRDFMDLAKPGKIQNYCKPNAMLTFKEYLEDYADGALKKKGEKTLRYHLTEIAGNSRELAVEVEKRLERIAEGERDLYF